CLEAADAIPSYFSVFLAGPLLGFPGCSPRKIRDDLRMDYTALGQTANLASRTAPGRTGRSRTSAPRGRGPPDAQRFALFSELGVREKTPRWRGDRRYWGAPRFSPHRREFGWPTAAILRYESRRSVRFSIGHVVREHVHRHLSP